MNSVETAAPAPEMTTKHDAPKVMTDLRSVRFPKEFEEGARNAVTTCLRIQPDEKVTLITDESCIAIAASMAVELDRLGCAWNGFVLEEQAKRPLDGMPESVLEDMESSQVSIFAVEVQPKELRSRMQMTDVVNRRRMRHAHMVNITPEIMTQGMRADFLEIDRPEPGGAGQGEEGDVCAGDDASGHGPARADEPGVQMVQDERDHQHGRRVGKPAGWGVLYGAGRGEWGVCGGWGGRRFSVQGVWVADGSTVDDSH